MEVSIDIKNINWENAADYVIKELQNRAQTACKWAADELTDEARNAIDDFYGSYSPAVYGRTGGLNQSYRRYYSNKHGNIIYGGVELTDSSSSYSSVLSGKGVDNAFVTSLAWFAGRHGFTEAFPDWMHINNYPPTTSPTPHERVVKRLHEVEGKLESFF